MRKFALLITCILLHKVTDKKCLNESNLCQPHTQLKENKPCLTFLALRLSLQAKFLNKATTTRATRTGQ